MNDKAMGPAFTGHLGEVYIRCERGDWHKLSKGNGSSGTTPSYRCEGELRWLKVGDVVEVRELGGKE